MTYYIDKDTGTWGRSEDIRVADLSDEEVAELDTMTDAERIELFAERGA